MKISSIKEVYAMEDDAVVYAFKAKLKSISKYFPPKEGDSDSQAFQAATLADGSQEIKALFRNREAIPKGWVGRVVLLTAKHGERGWTGLKAKDNERDNKTERVLWVTATATLELFENDPPESGGGSSGSEGASGNSSTASASSSATETTAKTPAEREVAERRALVRARCALGQYVNAMFECDRAAKHLDERQQNELGCAPMDHARKQAVCSTFFIKLDRCGLIDELPVKPSSAFTRAKEGADPAAAEAAQIAEEAARKAKEEADRKAAEEAAAKKAQEAERAAEDDVPF